MAVNPNYNKILAEALAKEDEQQLTISISDLKEIRAEIKGKCDGINDLVDGELSYPLHRGVQELICDILEILDRRIEGASK